MKRLMKTHLINLRAIIYCTEIENIKMVEVLLWRFIFFEKRNDLSINCEAAESFSIEITNNETKNMVYRVTRRWYSHLWKIILLAGEFYINLLHFEQNKKVQNFINLTFQFGLVPTANTPIRITKRQDFCYRSYSNKFYNK